MVYTFARTPENVVTDAAGNVVSGWRIDVYDAAEGGTRVTDLEAPDGTALPGYVTTDTDGRYEFRRATDDLGVLWGDDGQSGRRWALIATEVMTAAAGARADADQAAADAASAQQDASDAADSASQAASSASTADDALSDLSAYQTQTPTLEEQLFTVHISGVPTAAHDVTQCYIAGDTSGNAMTVLVAPFPLTILSISLTWDYYSIAADDNTYWRIVLARSLGTEGGGDIAERTTQATGSDANGGITSREAWTFSGIDLAQYTFDTGDTMQINPRPVGSPTDMLLNMCVTIQYAPV